MPHRTEGKDLPNQLHQIPMENPHVGAIEKWNPYKHGWKSDDSYKPCPVWYESELSLQVLSLLSLLKMKMMAISRVIWRVTAEVLMSVN